MAGPGRETRLDSRVLANNWMRLTKPALVTCGRGLCRVSRCHTDMQVTDRGLRSRMSFWRRVLGAYAYEEVVLNDPKWGARPLQRFSTR